MGAGGAAIAFCDPTERAYLSDIEKLIKRRLTVIGHEPGPANPKLASPDRGGRGRSNARPNGNANTRKLRNGPGPKTGQPGKNRNRHRNRAAGRSAAPQSAV